MLPYVDKLYPVRVDEPRSAHKRKHLDCKDRCELLIAEIRKLVKRAVFGKRPVSDKRMQMGIKAKRLSHLSLFGVVNTRCL